MLRGLELVIESKKRGDRIPLPREEGWTRHQEKCWPYYVADVVAHKAMFQNPLVET
jgi:hypothetical protein